MANGLRRELVKVQSRATKYENDMTNKISGSCLCGSVQYSSDAEPVITAICHCENCQRQTGSSFSIIVCVPEDTLKFQQKHTLAEYLDYSAAGQEVRRKFCQNCGSPIFSLVESAPGLGIIKAGTLNDSSWLNPTTEFWCSSAQPWLEMSNEMTKYDQNPA